MRLRQYSTMLAFVVLLGVGGSAMALEAPTPNPAPPAAAVDIQSPEPVAALARIDRRSASDPSDAGLAGETDANRFSRVIVGLRLSWRPEGRLAPEEQEQQRFAISASQEQLLDELRGTGATVIHSYVSIPFQVLEVTPAALAILMASPLVSTIEPDRILRPLLAESVPLIQGDQAWASGYDGTGTAVAILDTGVEASHPFFGGRVVAEACYSTNATNVASLCPNGQATQTGLGAASPAGCTGISGCDHGTHVAGITAGSGASFSGVARGAAIIGVQVFSKFTSATDCGGAAPCVSSFFSDLIRGLEHVLTLKDAYQIASVNMSLGGGKYTSEAACDAGNTAVKTAIDNLRSVGIASVISSGNDAFTDGIATPGCISTAIAVGSTTKQDAISSFSNSSPMVDLLAPGSSINSAVPGGGFGVKSGTSMATPHVTGAWAILKEQSPSATVSEVLSVLATSGLGITDARNGVTKPRLRIKNALSPGFSVNDVSVGEGNTGTANASFTVTLNPPASSTVTVQYQTANGTAAAGTDYAAASGTLTFLSGESAKPITVVVNGDSTEEPNETFLVNLINASGGISIVDGQGLGTITNDDTPSCSVVTPGVVDGTFEAGNPWPAWTTQASTNFGTPLCDAGCGTGGGMAPPYSGSSWAWFGGVAAAETGILGQSLALPTSTDLRLRFQMRIGGVAAPASDTFAVALDGTAIATFAEPAVAEAAYTQREISLTPFANGTVRALRFTYTHPDSGSGNLTMDDVQVVNCQGPSLPALSIGDLTAGEGNTGTSTATFTVFLSAAGATAVTVGYATADGSATAGSDYVATSGTLTFAPGVTTQSISVTVNGDTAIEPDETFSVNLGNPTNATIGDSLGVGTITNDDLPPAAFTDTGAALAGASGGSVAWGDYDRDGDMDILITGSTGASRTAQVYRNAGPGIFTDAGASLTGTTEGSASWADYDNDGDLDLLLTGFSGPLVASSPPTTKLYRNDVGTFVEVGPTGLPAVAYSSAAWGDYDNDGDLDILLTGWSAPGSYVAGIYRNDGGGRFTDIGAGLTPAYEGSAAWGDYDNDGDLDILLTGRDSGSYAYASVYRNDGGGAFTDIGAGLHGVLQQLGGVGRLRQRRRPRHPAHRP